MKSFVEVVSHFCDPLEDESFRGDDQGSTDKPSQLQFSHDQTGFDGLSQPDLIGQEVADTVLRQNSGQSTNLVGQRDN